MLLALNFKHMKYIKQTTPNLRLSRRATLQESLVELIKVELPTIWWDDRADRKPRRAKTSARSMILHETQDRICKLEAAIVQVGIALASDCSLERNGF